MNDAYKRQLEEIYKSNYERHIRYATFLLRNSNLAEDMVHKAFLLAIENEEKSKYYPEAWIMKTLKNVCMNYIKQYAIRKPKDDDYIENQPVSEPSFDVNSDTLLTLQQELNEQDYALLVQYCFQHKTVQEISEETGLTPNHIHVRLFRIRNEIRKIIFPLFVILLFSQEI